MKRFDNSSLLLKTIMYLCIHKKKLHKYDNTENYIVLVTVPFIKLNLPTLHLTVRDSEPSVFMYPERFYNTLHIIITTSMILDFKLHLESGLAV